MKKKAVIICLALIFAAVLFWLFSPPSFYAVPYRTTKSLNNVKQIGIACYIYAKENENRLPHSFKELLDAGYISDNSILYSPFGPKDEIGYELKASGSFPAKEPLQILVTDRYRTDKGMRAVFYSDLQATMIKE